MKKRVQYLDVLRGISILLVLFSHVFQSSFIGYPTMIAYHLLYAFHVPMFVFISGYVLSDHLKISFLDFVKNRFFRLFVPYLVWMTVIAFVYKDALLVSNPFQFFFRGFLFPQTPWFLYTLFFSSAVSSFILRANKYPYLLGFVILVFASNMMKDFFLENDYVLNSISILHYSFILLAGYYFAKKDRKTIYRIPLLVCCLLYIFIYFLNDFEIRNLSYFYPFKLFTIFSLIYVSFFAVRRVKWLYANTFLQWFGRHALQLYVLHYLYLNMVSYNNNSLALFIISFLCLVVATTCTLLILQKIVKKQRSIYYVYNRIFGNTS